MPDMVDRWGSFPPGVKPPPATLKGSLRQVRPGSALLVAILVVISVLPVFMLMVMSSCAGVKYPAVHPKEQITYKAQPKVRVALASHTRGGADLAIKVTGAYTVLDPITTTIYLRGPWLAGSPVGGLSNGIVITVPVQGGASKTVHLDRIRIMPTKSGTLHVGPGQYRGVLDIVYNRDGTMTLVNEIDLEEYVGGVVAAEMFHWWPKAALEAQAVVARTYTLALMMEGEKVSPGPEYDLEAGYLTAQEYQGVRGEHPRALEAVRATSGIVLTHNGSVFRTYFSSCCGGHTEACGVVWDDYATIPPLAGRECEYCRQSPWFNWKQVIKLPEMETALRRAGKDVGAVVNLQFSDTNGEGHVDRVNVRGTRRTVAMSGNDFRLALGSIKLKSMDFRARRINEAYEFTGHGWGHGAGMCQYGAKGLAEALSNYERILQYYYPGTQVLKVY